VYVCTHLLPTVDWATTAPISPENRALSSHLKAESHCTWVGFIHWCDEAKKLKHVGTVNILFVIIDIRLIRDRGRLSIYDSCIPYLGSIYIRGLYFGPQAIFIPLPPSRNTSFFDSYRVLFSLIPLISAKRCWAGGGAGNRQSTRHIWEVFRCCRVDQSPRCARVQLNRPRLLLQPVNRQSDDRGQVAELTGRNRIIFP
jgi:hypothetical protein